MSDLQMSKFWIHPYKWTGYNSTWIKYLEEAFLVTEYHKHEKKQNTETRKIIERSGKFLSILYHTNCESADDIDNEPEYQRLYDKVKTATRDGVTPPPSPIYLETDIRHPDHPNNAANQVAPAAPNIAAPALGTVAPAPNTGDPAPKDRKSVV